MIEITEQNPREILEILLHIWESSVRATHKFLSRSEIERIKGEVEAMFAQMGGVICAKFDGEIVAFMVCADEKIEALFWIVRILEKASERPW